MKKFESLGRSLSKIEQKKIMGGLYDDGGGGATCTYTYTGSNGSGSSRTCDYHVVCTSGVDRDLCGFTCMRDCDSSGTSCTR